jgi:hypothetical protein
MMHAQVGAGESYAIRQANHTFSRGESGCHGKWCDSWMVLETSDGMTATDLGNHKMPDGLAGLRLVRCRLWAELDKRGKGEQNREARWSHVAIGLNLLFL